MMSLHFWRQFLPLALAAAVCMWVAQLPAAAAYGISPLTLAVAAGMAAGHLFPQFTPHLSDALAFCKTRLLRLGIVLYGIKITLAQLMFAGWPALLAGSLMLVSTFTLALWCGRRLGLHGHAAALIGAGASICGAAAVLATQPVLKARESDVGVAVATVVAFGTLAMFAYPLMAAWLLPDDAAAAAWFAWGIYTGASVHEVAQVAAAGAAVNPFVADVAVITKMIRVMLLAPFLLLLPYVMRRWDGQAAGKGKIVIPWFAVGFVAVAVANSLISLPPALYRALTTIDTFLLTAAMLALGLTTRWQTVRQAGAKPLWLAAVLALWLAVGGAAVAYAVFCWQTA